MSRFDSVRGISEPPPTTVEGITAELEMFERLQRAHARSVRDTDPAYVIAAGRFGFDGAGFARILVDEINRLQGERDAVRDLHRPGELVTGGVSPATKHFGCVTCRTDGPCPTARALKDDTTREDQK